ncbi:unnamed protein product, partial [Iphiclides podalirius]
MVLCPPFRWSSRGGFNLTNATTAESSPERRETISKLPEAIVDTAQTNDAISNGNGFIYKKSITLSVDPGISSKKSSYMSIQSGKSTGSKDSDSEETDDRKSSAGRKTISDLMQTDPEKRGRRKRGVIAPHAVVDTVRSSIDLQYEKFEKDDRAVAQIKSAIMANEFLKNLMDEERLKAVVEAMTPQEFPAGSLMIREGESGSHLYVSAHGQFEVLKGGQVVKNFGPGEAFGELAILYKAKRFASIRCITEAKVWMLERRVFQKIMVRSGRQEQEDNIRFLASVPLLREIHPIELAKISDFLKREFFSTGTAVVRQGDRGDKFYIIRGGTVAVTKRDGDGGEGGRLATVTALPPGVECLTLERGPFTELLGNLEELKNIRHAVPRASQQKKTSEVKSEYEFVELKDLEIVGTMGVGGFGRVELVQYKPQPSLTFALKCLKKVDMVQQQQQEHAYNEKNIMMLCNSPFICRLYRTFKDNKFIYFLMEPVLGGDVWTILQKQRYFPENIARFMAACVIEAFQYLHSKDIIYRDLKPENLMLDKNGYIKLVDFGFAKRISQNSKTWTFAGTPEYVAPEIVLNKGHDRAVDCWALGVFIHELLVGKPPFRAAGGDHMKTYTLILRGIDAIAFHPRVPKSAQMLIRKLCRAVPAERLGYLKNGIVDIKNHKWFLGFDWEGLRDRKLKAPLVQPVANDYDLSNFEKYPKDSQQHCFDVEPPHPLFQLKNYNGGGMRARRRHLYRIRPGRSAALPSPLLRHPSSRTDLLLYSSTIALARSSLARRTTAPILYLAIYWLLSATAAASILWRHFLSKASSNHVELYIQGLTTVLAFIMSIVDGVCFYDEVSKNNHGHQESSRKDNTSYKHNETHFYSKITFFWLNSLLYKGYWEMSQDENDFGNLPDDERSLNFYEKFKRIYHKRTQMSKLNNKKNSIWRCYVRTIWPNFYVAGVLKLFGDLIGVIPPLGLAVIVQYIEDPLKTFETESEVTMEELLKNAYIMLFVVTLALIIQAILSQNSTHLVTVEGTRLKTALQCMVYDKCMRLASWSSAELEIDEESPLLQAPEDTMPSQSGLLTNLISQDTYNIMSCVWVCHYIWAIPLKVAIILYLLYTKLGISAIIGTAASVILITPLQFYIGKKLSDNSKDISKCTDHRVSKMSEILQGMNVIKLYVWEDLFNEKILQLREVELRLLNKDSVYWGFLTFTTHASTILITVVTYTLLYFLDNGEGLTVVNVLAGLALFNQLAIPLLILPVTVLMVIQAMVSTKRIEDFLELPESSNISEERHIRRSPQEINTCDLVRNNADTVLNCNTFPDSKEIVDIECDDKFFEDNKPNCNDHDYLLRFKKAAFSWKMRDNTWLDVDDLDIPVGKLIMVVGSSGSGKSSFLSAMLGEMHLERGDVIWNGAYSACYAGQPPWLIEGSIRDNILMGQRWNPAEYARALRAAALRPDLQLLPDGDRTKLGRQGAPLSGGQRVRVCIARCVYSGARLLALDEPLGALDAALARHVVARGLLPAVRTGTTVIIATNRLELLHYADLVIAMEDGRVCDVGRPGSGVRPCSEGPGIGTLRRWARRAAEARAAVARAGAGPPGGSARERARLQRALSRNHFSRRDIEEDTVGISEPTGAHLLAEVPTRAGGSWRRTSTRPRPSLSRWRRDVRRAVSADESDTNRPRVHRTLARWTPRTLHRLLSTESDTQTDEQSSEKEESATIDTTFVSVTSNGIETTTSNKSEHLILNKENLEDVISESSIWWVYAKACGWWGAMYWLAAAAAQALALAADWWLSDRAAKNSQTPLADGDLWVAVCAYVWWGVGGAAAAGAAQACCACAGAGARRAIHERLLRATLHAPPHRAQSTALHRFSADIAVVDRKLSTAVTRWAQLALLCAAAVLLNLIASIWTLLAFLPAFFCFLLLQNVYLQNARELQRFEASSAARVLSLGGQTSAGASTVRACRLQTSMRAAFLERLDHNHNALLLLNAANRWLGLTLDLVGAASVCVSLGAALAGGGSAAVAGLAGAYALLLPAYLAHLAKCRADLHQQLAALERLVADTNVPQEDYREDCPIPLGWQRNGKIEFENVTIRHHPDAPPVLRDINLTVNPGEKLAICGRSGSGKSTLLMSCAGATTISEGRVLVDGAESSRVPLRALRHRVLVLPQDGVLFSSTLRENLDPLAVHTDEEIWQCLTAVGLHEFVAAQSAGLECPVGGSRGSWWSGGRGARLCAARAALHARFAAALLLDEPGAALDAPAERDLLAALAAAAPNTTVITVAHRVPSVLGYDRVAVLEEGRIVEIGDMKNLLAQPSSRLARMLATHNQAH